MLKIYFPFSIRRWYFVPRAHIFFLSFFNQFAYKLVITCSLCYLFHSPLSTAVHYHLPSSSSLLPYHFVKTCVCWAFVGENANHFLTYLLLLLLLLPAASSMTSLMTINPFTQAIRNCRRCIHKRINAKVATIARGRPHLSYRYPHHENVMVK